MFGNVKSTQLILVKKALLILNQIIVSAKVARGAYSDGKLYTRSKKRGNIEKILRVFCQHGATTDILINAHPHIGTDNYPL